MSLSFFYSEHTFYKFYKFYKFPAVFICLASVLFLLQRGGNIPSDRDKLLTFGVFQMRIRNWEMMIRATIVETIPRM